MKCSKCGNNEAVFFYSTDINGEKSEGCLCADCARSEALTDMGFGSFGGFFSDFLAPERALLRSFGSFGAPMRGIMAPSAVDSMADAFFSVITPGEETKRAAVPCGEAESRIPADAGEDIRRRRELGALREQLAAAVEAEDYEKAIGLRDKLKAMERDN